MNFFKLNFFMSRYKTQNLLNFFYLFLAKLRKVLDDKKFQTKSATIKAPFDEAPVPEGDKVNYKFSGLGHLIYKGQQFIRSFSRGQEFLTIYKCVEFKTNKCPVALKTRGKFLVSIVGHHNHEYLP